jgi:hypothetical protein
MQAAILEEYGAPFRIATISRPQPGPGQVLVRIAASSVNPLDVKIHGGAAGQGSASCTWRSAGLCLIKQIDRLAARLETHGIARRPVFCMGEGP